MEGIVFPIISIVLLCVVFLQWLKSSRQHVEQNSQVTDLRQQLDELQRVAQQAQSQEQLAQYATQTVQAQNSKLEQQVQKLEGQLAELQQINQKLQNYKETAQLEFQKQEHKLSNQVEILESDKNRLETLVEQIKDAQIQELSKLRAEHEEQVKLMKDTTQEAEERIKKNFDELFTNFKNSSHEQQLETKTSYEKQLTDLKAELQKKKEEAIQEQHAIKNEYEARIIKLSDDYETRLKEIQQHANELREKQAQTDKESFNNSLKIATDNFEVQKTQLKTNYEEHLAVLKQKQDEYKAEYEKQIATLQQLQSQELQRMREQHAQEFEQFKENIEKRNLELTNSQSQTFMSKTSQQLELITNPLKVTLEDVTKKIQVLVEQNNNTGVEFKTNMEQLGRYVMSMSEQSKDLVNALRKNNKKVLGNWGEMQLEILLEECGLIKGKTFFTQQSINVIAQKRQVPDFVVRLPEGRHLIIDAKTTLESYIEVTSAKTPEEEQAAARKLATKISDHVEGLAKKKYTEDPKLPACDFVLMYIPIENTLHYIAEYAPDIFNRALNKKIIIVSNTTLVPILTMIANVWKNYELQKNMQHVLSASNAFFDSLAGLATKLVQLGTNLDKTNSEYNEVVHKLTNVQGVLNRLKKYNTKASDALKSFENIDELNVGVSEGVKRLDTSIKTHLGEMELKNTPTYNVNSESDEQEEIATLQTITNFFVSQAAKYPQDEEQEAPFEEPAQPKSDPTEFSDQLQTSSHDLRLSVAPNLLHSIKEPEHSINSKAGEFALSQRANEELGIVEQSWLDQANSDLEILDLNLQNSASEDLDNVELALQQNVVPQTKDVTFVNTEEENIFVVDTSQSVTDWLRGDYYYYDAGDAIVESSDLITQLAQLYNQLLDILNTIYVSEQTQESATFAQVFYAYQTQQDDLKLDFFTKYHPYDVLNIVLGINFKNFQTYLEYHELGQLIMEQSYPKLLQLEQEFYLLQDRQHIIKEQHFTQELFEEYDAIFEELE